MSYEGEDSHKAYEAELQARIAELEADCGMWQRMAQDAAEHEVAGLEHIAHLEAELAALNARRCESCASRGTVVEGTCSCNWDARWNILSYACNRWQPRR